MDKRAINKTFFLFCIILFFTKSLKANDISTAYNQTIHIASGYEQLVKESPAAVSVISAEDIERIGAITIEEVLETIPGIHVTYANGFFPVYVIRGVGSALNTPVLIYLDGIPINNSVVSSSYFSLSHMVKNVERIEIIKGPGSALYGADAFSGVINIITKNNEKTDLGTYIGSFDSYGGWFNSGTKINDFKFNFSAQGNKTNGSNGIIQSDRQSVIDDLFRTNASLAPGSINRGREEVDIKLSAHYQEWARVYLRYIHNKSQNGIGVANALDNDGLIRSDSWITGIQLKFGPQDWQTTFDINYSGYVLDLRSNLFPKGGSGGLFRTPVINNFGYTSHEFSTEISTIYRKIKDHVLHLGFGYEYDLANEQNEQRNFVQGPFNSILPVGSLKHPQEIGALPFAQNESRYNFHGYIQDEWSIFNDFSLTTGVRLDYFSDFGLTVNPRASLVWNISPSLTTKIMYGRAFRAPSFFELDTNPGVTVTGNPDLDPETINTVEWSILKTWPHNLTTNLNLFWYETDDLITETIIVDPLTQSESRVFKNTGGANAYGLEFDLKYKMMENLSFDMNYAYLKQTPKNIENDQFIITSPRHQVYAAINWNITPNWSANIRSTSIIGRSRSSADTRSSIKDYTKLDFTLQSKNLLGYLDVTLKINNFLDANVREPSIDNNTIPGDYPLDGRSFTGIVSMTF